MLLLLLLLLLLLVLSDRFHPFLVSFCAVKYFSVKHDEVICPEKTGGMSLEGFVKVLPTSKGE